MFVIYCHLMYCFSGAYLGPEPAPLVAGSTLKKLVISVVRALVALGGMVLLVLLAGSGVWAAYF